MIDRAHAESLLYRVAVASMTYSPDKAEQQPGYSIEEDVGWCLVAVSSIPLRYRESMRPTIREVIEDSTGCRTQFTRNVMALVSSS